MADGPADDANFLQGVADLIGAPEPALRLLISILIGYPIVLVHRRTLYCKSPVLQHLYFVTTGIAIALFNYGQNTVHSAICVVFAWLVLKTMRGTIASVIVAFVFQMTYLLAGYYLTGTDTYDIKWSMPHCVLTLRLIALTYDVYDGTKDPSSLSRDQEKTALSFTPSLLEVAAHTYFPASFMVGPQFSMRRYLAFISGKLVGETPPPCVLPGILRGGLGLFYIAVYQVGIMFLPDAFINSPEYDELSFWMRHVVVGLWAKITLYKYIACWLIAEGVCITSGISYNGLSTDGCMRWDGCRNVKVLLWEGSTQFGHLIESFNTNTNAWVAQYVYKRLKFLNNRYVSQLAALVFLAVWHGLHSGYYACFFMEFVVINFERDVTKLVGQYPRLVSVLNAGPLKYIKLMVLKVYVVIFMGYCLGPFVLLKLHRWWSFYVSLYFSGHIFFAGWPLYAPAVKAVVKHIGGERVKPEAKKE